MPKKPREEYAIRITPSIKLFMSPAGTTYNYYVYKVKKPKDLDKKGCDKKDRMHIYSKKLSRTLEKFDGKFMGMVSIIGAYADDPTLQSFQPISGKKALIPILDHKPLQKLKGKNIPLLVKEKVFRHYYKNFIKNNDYFKVMYSRTMVPQIVTFNRENMGVEPKRNINGKIWEYELSKTDIRKALKKMRERIGELGLEG